MKQSKAGRPKKEVTKKHLGLRLAPDVITTIRDQPNQVAYIERLVRSDRNNVTKTNQDIE